MTKGKYIGTRDKLRKKGGSGELKFCNYIILTRIKVLNRLESFHFILQCSVPLFTTINLLKVDGLKTKKKNSPY